MIDALFILAFCTFTMVWIFNYLLPFHTRLRYYLSLAAFSHWLGLIPFYLYLKDGSELMLVFVMISFSLTGIFGALCGRELIKCSEFPLDSKRRVLITNKEKYVIKDYALSLKIYIELMNSFIRSTTTVLDQKLILNIIENVKKKVPVIYENCEVGKNRTVDFSPIRSSLDSIDEAERIHLIHEGFSSLIENLIESYGTTTSMEVSRQIFDTVFSSTIKGYRDIFYRCGIPFQMPEGTLKMEKARFLAFLMFKDALEGLMKECQWEMIARIHSSPEKLKRDISKRIVTKCLSTDGTIDIQKVNALFLTEGQKNFKSSKKMDQISNEFFHILNVWLPEIRKHLGDENANSIIESSFSRLPARTKNILSEIGIINRLPEGVLENEKISTMSKEELEFQVKERTNKLQKALVKVKKTKRELHRAYKELKKLDKMK